MQKILDLINELKDEEYRVFAAKLAPTLSIEHFIGVRVPQLRELTKQITEDDANIFFDELPHFYYEENLLHGFLIQKMKNYDECLKRLKEFLPYVDNWAVSDTMGPKVFKKNKDKVIEEVKVWIKSKETYTIRFGVDMLMSLYLDSDFKEEYLLLPLDIKSDEYYVNMMVAWFYATALAKKWDYAIKIVENKLLDKWTHNKTISKAIESYRITEDQKEYLRTLRIK